MKFGPHRVVKGGVYEIEHFVDGVHCRIILHDNQPASARQRAEQIVADLSIGAARRANGAEVPVVEPTQILPYGPAGHAEHADGVWMGEGMVGGVGYYLTAPAPTYDEGKVALTRLFSDLAAGETLAMSQRLVARYAGDPEAASVIVTPAGDPDPATLFPAAGA
ncbi:MAG: hypothetical protein ACRYHQ_23205 [Janthinobacterium lividum]